MDRRRIEVDDATDRLGDLPDSLLHDILSRLGPHQAVQTSVLSRRWRHMWREVLRAIVVVDEREFAGGPWEIFEDFADQLLLSIPPEKKLDFFHLNLVSHNPSVQNSDTWIRRGLRHCPTAVYIRAAYAATICWKPHCSYFSPPRLQPDLSVSGSCAAGLTRRLTTLRLVGVAMSANFVEDLGKYCPVLVDLHVESCVMVNITTVSSPTLTSLAIVETPRPLTCAHFRIVAPLLSRLHLELAYDGQDCNCVAAALATGTELPSPASLVVVEASIRLTDNSYNGQTYQQARKMRKIEFLKSMGGLLALLIPNVVKLCLSGFTTTALVEEEFPVLHCLKTLILERCDLGVEFQALAGILWNTPGLEKLGMHLCTFIGPLVKKRMKRGRQPSKSHITTPCLFWCEKLASIEIKRRQQDEPHFAMVLSEISERMQPELWRRVTISSTIV